MSNRQFHFISRRELLIIVGVLVIAVITLFASGAFGKKGKYAVIQYGDVTETVSLESSGEFTLVGCGDTVFEIFEGKICISKPVCPDKICSETGSISRAGQSIICVPEKIVITVKNSSSDENSADVTVG